MRDPFESEYADSLRALDRRALSQLRAILQDDASEERERLLRDLMTEPHSLGVSLLGQLVAICDEDCAARLEVLRGIRDALRVEV
jgi:hypothetical protein